MSPAEILEKANHHSVPSFVFGSMALEDWTNRHRDKHTGQCFTESGFYVVVHRTHTPERSLDFRVLSRWDYLHCVPKSWDVPEPDVWVPVMKRLTETHGWTNDPILKNLATKFYDSIVGEKKASLWFSFDATNNLYYLRGTFVSAGEDVLAGRCACIPGTADQSVIHQKVDDYLADVEKAIAGAYAVRLLASHDASTDVPAPALT